MENTEDKKRFILKSFVITNLAISNLKTVFLISFMIIIAGIGAYTSMPKEAFPELNIPEIYIGIAYPGVGPKDIEEKITKKIEKEINTIRGVDKIKSTSMFGYATIVTTFDFKITPEQGLRKVKDAVDKARGDQNFPELTIEPNIFEMNFSEFPIMNINLRSDAYSQEEIYEFAKYLEDEIETEVKDEVSKVEIRGVQKKEVKVEVDKSAAESRLVSFDDIQNAIARNNKNISAGEIKDNGIARSMRVEGEFTDLEQLRELPVKVEDGKVTKLRHVAEVSFGEEDISSYAREFGQPVVMIDVIKRSGTNLLSAAAKIKSVIDKAYEENRIPEEVKYTITNDMSFKTQDQVANLENSIILGVILVVLVLQLFLGLRSALFVGIAIPMSMFMSFFILDTMGITLNIMVLFSLVLALGMLVDNGIVVIENIYRQLNDGMKMFDAVKYGVGEIAWPIISSTATTVAAFVPLMMWPGIMGEFMQYLPLTLMIVLSSSLFVALIINPVLAIIFMKKDEPVPDRKKVIRKVIISVAIGMPLVLMGSMTIGNLILFWTFFVLLNYFVLNPGTKFFQTRLLPKTENMYRNFLFTALSKHPGKILIGSFILLVLSFIIVGLKQPKVLFFPDNQPAYVNVFIEMPIGTDISLTNEVAGRAEKAIMQHLKKYDDAVHISKKDTIPLINSVITQVGEGTSDPMAGPQMGNTPHKARITVAFCEAPYRGRYQTSDIMKEIDSLLEKQQFEADVQIVVDKDPAGPPQEPPINIELYGEDYDSLIVEAEKMLVKLNSLEVDGIEKLRLDVETGKPELPIYTNQGLTGLMDITPSQIGMALRTSLFGADVSTFKIGDEEYDINVKYKDSLRRDVEALLSQKITFRNMKGQMVQVPVNTLIKNPVRTSTYSAVKHKRLDKVVTIYSKNEEGYNANEIVDKLKKEMKDYKPGNGVTFKFTGQMEEQAKEMGFLSKALLITVFLVFLIIVTQFNSISSPAIIMTSVLLSLIGVLLGLVIFNMDFVIIMTMIGIISLAGVVVNNAIVLIDFVILLLKRKREELNIQEEDILPMNEIIKSISEAGAMRLRPVLLTAITTLLGLIPLAVGININFITLLSDYDPQFFIGGDNVMFFGPLSWTVIFGLTFATFLTLVVVPVTFLLIFKMKRWVHSKTNWGLFKSY